MIYQFNRLSRVNIKNYKPLPLSKLFHRLLSPDLLLFYSSPHFQYFCLKTILFLNTLKHICIIKIDFKHQILFCKRYDGRGRGQTLNRLCNNNRFGG